MKYNSLVDQYMTAFTENTIQETLDICLEHLVLSPTDYENVMDLLKGLLAFEPSERMDVDDLLECEIFKTLNLPEESKVPRYIIGKRTPIPKSKVKKINQYPEICDTDDKKYFAILPLNNNARHGLKFILALYYGMFKQYYVRDLFMSLDLYMRLIYATRNTTKKMCKYIAILVTRMTYKYYYNSASTFPSDLENEIIIGMELTAIKFLEGIIKNPTFYDSANNEEELIYFLDKMTDDNFAGFDQYFLIDYSKMKKIKSTNPKIISCEKFFDNLGIEF
jgi:hypothetical protein